MIQWFLFFAYMGALLLSALLSIIYRKYLSRWHLSIMAIYLPLLFVLEVYTGLRLYVWHESTAAVYNIYKPVSVIVFAIFYYYLPTMGRFRKAIIGITVVYLVAIILTFTFFKPLTVNNTYITLARGACISFFAIFFLMSIFLLDNPAEENFWQPVLWITIGVLVFYPVISIAVGFEELLRNSEATVGGIKLYQAIPRLMSIFMYSCFSYAFYLCKRKS